MASKKIWWLIPLLAVAACGNSHSGSLDGSGYKSSGSSASADSTATTDEGLPINSPQRKIIHTADFHCRVKNVFSATTEMEKLVRSMGGIVQSSTMENSTYDTKTSYYTADSLRQTQTYATTAILTLRVPSALLDSVVGAIPAISSFIDSRVLKQSDVTYQYLTNELKNKTGNNNAADRAMKLAKKSHEPIEVQQYEDDKQQQAITRKVENMHLMDDVNYATLTIAFTQPEQVLVQAIVNPNYVSRTPFGLQCKSALVSGWELIRSFIVAILKLWPLVLLAIFSVVAWRRWRRPVLLARK